jgi:hypothetical protein
MAVYHYGAFQESLGYLFGPGSAAQASIEIETGTDRNG